MSLFIRSEWLAAETDSIEERIAAAVGLLHDPAVTTIVGSQWHFLGRSKKEALSKAVASDELSEKKKWRRIETIPGQSYYGLDLWNGCEHPEAANVSIAINSPQSSPNTFVISGLDISFLVSTVPWEGVLCCARRLAERLGGLVIVSSHELLDLAKASQLENPERTAYAAFWGIDLSGKNPQHKALIKRGVGLPFEMVICSSWEDVQTPDRNRLIQLINLLASA